MDKGRILTGQPIFTQLLNFIPRDLVNRLVSELQTDRYYKKFKTYDHLVAMLFTCFQRCNSIREVTTGMMASFNKLVHLGLQHAPRRSTLSDANRTRSEVFFGRLYHELYKLHFGDLPDSRFGKTPDDMITMFDSTTIKLFSSVMEGLGRKPETGKQKGGAKAHIMMKSHEDVPSYVLITRASENDKVFLKKLRLDRGSIVVFDKAYNNFNKLAQWKKEGIIWVTRLWRKTSYEVLASTPVSAQEQAEGVISDEKILMGRPSNKDTVKVKARKIVYFDTVNQRQFEFITNDMNKDPSRIASIYKRRWQIEILFRRIKQNYQLKYFLGDNENAIKIQIWCALITDLLVKMVKDKVGRKKMWSYANIASMIRLHLMNYLNLFHFLWDPEKALTNHASPSNGQQLAIVYD